MGKARWAELEPNGNVSVRVNKREDAMNAMVRGGNCG